MEPETKKKNTLVRVIIIVLALAVIGVGVFLCQHKKETPKKEESKTYLTLKDFPLIDDRVEDGKYVKFKGSMEWSPEFTFNESEKTITGKVNDYSFVLKSEEEYCYGGDVKNELEAIKFSLKINDVTVKEDMISYPFIIITDKNVIVQFEVNVDDQEVEQAGLIYIYDKDLKKQLEIKDVNTFMFNDSYSNLNGTLNFAIKDNVLYYVTANANKRALKYVDLNKDELKEEISEEYSRTETIPRNMEIKSIDQFPYKSNPNGRDLINGYKVTLDSRNYAIEISKDGETVKTLNYVYLAVNSRYYNTITLDYYVYESKIYYIKDNKDDTMSLVSIDFKNDLKEEVIETFKVVKNVENRMFFGDCDM